MLCILGLCLAPLPAQAKDAFAALKERAAAMTSVRSDFTQETSLPMFKEPLHSRGRFVFAKPDTLLWEYLSPIQEGFVLRGNTGFRWQDDKKNRTPFTSGSDPLAAIIARQITAWILFDMRSIEREYRIDQLPGPVMRLKMTPLKKDVGAVIDSITIAFTPQGPASRVEITETKGGRTVISFTNTIVNVPLDNGLFDESRP
jgi:outer membrane lipoprotein-sorting protein